MEIALIYLALVPLVAVVLMSRSAERRRLNAVERLLGLIVDHLGIVEPEPAEVARHLDNRDRLRAVRAYMKITGTDLQTANDAVKRMAAARLARDSEQSP